MNILTEYPVWFIIFCLAAGILFALALYLRDRKSEFPPAARFLMMFIRFLSISLISFLLLSPLFKMQVQVKEKPKLLIFVDNSQSIIQGADSSYYRNKFLSSLNKFREEASDVYDPVQYSFSGSVQPEVNSSFNGVRTDLASVFRFIEDRYSNRNIGAVVLATDGIYNTGANPVYAGASMNYPLYTLALGDTMKIPDVRINQVNYNEIAFLGNEFPVELNLHADKSKGEQVDIVIRKEGRMISSRTVIIDDEAFNKNYSFLVKAEQPGLQEYTVEVSALDHELNKDNNHRDIFVDVIDTKQKILMLYNAPHPDVAAIKSVLQKNKQYELEVQALKDFKKNIEQYNLLIFHQLPSSSVSSVKLKEQIDAAGIPVLYIIGSQTDLGFFNNMAAGLKISNAVDFEDAFPAVDQKFGLFSLSENLKKAINQWPPLQVYFGNYLLSNSAYTMLDQSIANMVTDKPLVMFNAPANEKSAVIAGEGIWRWRINDYNRNGNQDNFDELIGKMIRYLSLQADKQQFNVRVEKIFNEFEEVEFDARLYNENYETVNQPEVNLVVIGEQGKEYPFVMGRKEGAYHLNAGSFPVGEYSYRASVEWNNEKLTDNGKFRVKNSNLEHLNMAADHHLLYRLSEMHQGEMFYPAQMQELEKKLLDSGAASVVSYQQEYTELLNLPWLLGLLVFFLAAEWFLRKWNGSY